MNEKVGVQVKRMSRRQQSDVQSLRSRRAFSTSHRHHSIFFFCGESFLGGEPYNLVLESELLQTFPFFRMMTMTRRDSSSTPIALHIALLSPRHSFCLNSYFFIHWLFVHLTTDVTRWLQVEVWIFSRSWDRGQVCASFLQLFLVHRLILHSSVSLISCHFPFVHFPDPFVCLDLLLESDSSSPPSLTRPLSYIRKLVVFFK